jgi:hypothetical protein
MVAAQDQIRRTREEIDRGIPEGGWSDWGRLFHEEGIDINELTTRLTLVLSELSNLERLGPSAVCRTNSGHSFAGQSCFWAHSPEFS